MHRAYPSSGEAVLVSPLATSPRGNSGGDAECPGIGPDSTPSCTPRSGEPEVGLADWPQLSAWAVEELASTLEFLVEEAEKDPARLCAALEGVVVPWFQQADPAPLLRALGGEDGGPRPLLHPEAAQRSQVAAARLATLLPDVRFDDGHHSSEVTGTIDRLMSDSRHVRLYGQMRGTVAYRGIVVCEATIWLPKKGFVFVHGTSAACERARPAPVRGAPLSPPGVAGVLGELTRASRGGRRPGPGAPGTRSVDGRRVDKRW